MSLIEKLFMAFTVVVCSVMFFVFCGRSATGSDGVPPEIPCAKNCNGVNLEECSCSEENRKKLKETESGSESDTGIAKRLQNLDSGI